MEALVVEELSGDLCALRRYLEQGLGPASKLTDAQIGLIVVYVRDKFCHDARKRGRMHKP